MERRKSLWKAGRVEQVQKREGFGVASCLRIVVVVRCGQDSRLQLDKDRPKELGSAGRSQVAVRMGPCKSARWVEKQAQAKGSRRRGSSGQWPPAVPSVQSASPSPALEALPTSTLSLQLICLLGQQCARLPRFLPAPCSERPENSASGGNCLEACGRAGSPGLPGALPCKAAPNQCMSPQGCHPRAVMGFMVNDNPFMDTRGMPTAVCVSYQD